MERWCRLVKYVHEDITPENQLLVATTVVKRSMDLSKNPRQRQLPQENVFY